MKILVTGGAGFIGSHIVEALVSRGHTVRVVDDLSTGKVANLANVMDKIEFINGDIGDFTECCCATRDISAVCHHAGIASVRRSIMAPDECNIVNATGTLNLLECCKTKRFVFASSSAIYGDGPESPKLETMCPSPKSPYAAAKLASEAYIHAFASCYGLDAISLRYFNVYGPRQDPNSEYAGVIAKFASLMRKGERPTIYGDGSQTRDFVYVADVVRANVLALESKEKFSGQAVNIGTSIGRNLMHVFNKLKVERGTNMTPIMEPGRAGDIQESIAYTFKACTLLGWVPKTNFADGLKLTLEAMKENV